jgi:hypothetical protein
MVETARENGFNLKVLRLSLAAYRIARTIGVDRVFSTPVVANRGTTAGSVLGTTELRILLTDLMFSLEKMWGAELKLRWWPDHCGQRQAQAVVETVERSPKARTTLSTFQKRGLQASVTKSLAVASPPTVRRKLDNEVAKQALKPTSTVKIRGCAYGGGRRRATSGIINRVAKFHFIVDRMQALGNVGGSTLECVHSAGTPGMIHGSGLRGTALTMLKKISGLADTAVLPTTACKNPTLILRAVSMYRQRAHPHYALHAGLIKAWADAWIDGCAYHNQLRNSLQDARTKINGGPTNHWDRVTGLAAAAYATMLNLRW